MKAVQKLELSIDFRSQTVPLIELQNSIGVEPSDGSHDLRDVHPDGSLWAETRLRMTSSLGEYDSLERHLESLRDLISGARANAVRLPEDCQVDLDIAVFHDTPIASVDVPLHLLVEFPIPISSIHVTAYTCVFAERQD